jgi:hypothetical protein
MDSTKKVFNIKGLVNIIKQFLENRCKICNTNDKSILKKEDKYCIWCRN